MRIIPRWHEPYEPPAKKFVADVRAHHNMVALIRGMPKNCVAITLRPNGAISTANAERAARRRGIRIIWLARLSERAR
jgi:hypothetical protein